MTLSIIDKIIMFGQLQLALNYLNDFYKKWKDNHLVIENNEIMSTLNISQGLNLIKHF